MDVKPDKQVAREFRQRQTGHHSPQLERVLSLFRGQDMANKFVLIEVNPHEEWLIGQLSGTRGEPVKVSDRTPYRLKEDAEWEIFKRRWKYHFSEALDELE